MADKKKPQQNGSSFVYGKTSLDVEALRAIVEVIEASEVTQLVWQNGDEKLVIRRGNPVTQVMHHGPAHGPAAVHVVPSPAAPPEPHASPRPSIATRPTSPA